MSVRYDKVVPALKALLPEEPLTLLGRAVAFIRRLREIRASAFVWSVVLSRFGSGRPGFEQARQWYERLTGATLWPRPFQMRFKSAAAVRLFERAFLNAVKPWRVRRRARHPLARHFPDIAVIDSTLLQVDDTLRRVFKGARGAMASLKALLTVSAFGLVPLHAELCPGNRHDMNLFPAFDVFVKGTLLLFDKGFVAYDRLRRIAEASLLYLCPMRLNGNALVLRARRAPKFVRQALRRHPEGVWLRDLLPADKRIGKVWDLDVVLWPKTAARERQQVATRLVIVPGPKRAQRPYLTNLKPSQWSPRALAELYRLRWQVELVFKELKQNLNLESLPSKDCHAVQVFTWASLLALAVSRTVASCLCPLPQLVGLAPGLRPALVTRALRSTLRLLARALSAPPRRAHELLEIFAEEVALEIRARDRPREDSFQRLRPLLRAA
jgi:DDE family transposase